MTSILIIERSGECYQAVSHILGNRNIKLLTASKVDVARKMLADNSPDLILADCAVYCDPLFWLTEADRYGLATQLVAICDQVDFNQAMDWVAGGVLNVLLKPIETSRLEKLLYSAIENSATLNQLDRSLLSEASKDLSELYRGLCGRLEAQDLKNFIIESCKSITGARKVELNLSDIFAGSSYNLETHVPVSIDLTACADQSGLDNCGLATREYHLDYELTANGHDLGEIKLIFNDEADLKIRRQEDLVEMIMAISNALGASATHNKAVKLAAHDALTGLYNRRIFNELLKREFAKSQRHNYPLTVVAIDLDHFKKVNDTYGHQVGDEVLKTVANTIQAVARNTDFPARLGGEEFAILLTHTSQEQAKVLAERLRKSLAEISFEVGGSVFHQTISQGISGLEHFMAKSPEDMLYWADQSLYLAKREGRDTIRTVSDLPMTPIMKDGAYAFQ